jgi:hypothetical protein
MRDGKKEIHRHPGKKHCSLLGVFVKNERDLPKMIL